MAEVIDFSRNIRNSLSADFPALQRMAENAGKFASSRYDWSVIAAVKQAVGIAVFGSGEVRTAADALRMMSQTRCDAVLVARGALGNPWIFRDAKHLLAGGSAAQLRRPTPADVLRVMKEHYRLLVTHAGRRKANLLFRRVGGYYCSHIPDSDQLKQSLQQSRQDDDIAAVLAGRP